MNSVLQVQVENPYYQKKATELIKHQIGVDLFLFSFWHLDGSSEDFNGLIVAIVWKAVSIQINGHFSVVGVRWR